MIVQRNTHTHRYDSANGLLAKNDRLSPESRRVLPKTNSNEAPTAKLLRLKRIMSKPGYNTKLYQPCFHPGEPCTKENCPCVQNGIFNLSGTKENLCTVVVWLYCDKAFPGCKCRQGRCRTWCSSVAFFENVTSFSCSYQYSNTRIYYSYQ